MRTLIIGVVLALGVQTLPAEGINPVQATRKYQELVGKVKAEQQKLNDFVKSQAELCKPKSLSLDADGFLGCIVPPPVQTPPAPAPAPATTPAPAQEKK